ncbi:DUF2163 domain-containing protein [Aliihoeflea sp. PC F10.4]
MTDVATTLCFCWRVTLKSGDVLGFTDHDKAVDFQGTRFEPQSGFTQSEAQASLGLAVDTAEIEGALSSARLSEEDIDAGLFDGAKVETFRADWRDASAAKLIRVSAIGKIIRRDGTLVAELESLTRNLDRPAGRYLRRSCDAELGDARCRANLSGAMMANGTIVSRQGDRTFIVAGLDGFAEGWFVAGRLTVGDISAKVVAHRKGTAGVLLGLGEDREFEIGTAFTIIAGCDKTFATCAAKFGNTQNFRGFPHLPGNDAAYGYVSEDGVFDGGALVP